MKKQTLPRIVRHEEPPKMTGRAGYRKAEVKLRLLSFLRNEIEALQRELAVGIPFIASHEGSEVE